MIDIITAKAAAGMAKGVDIYDLSDYGCDCITNGGMYQIPKLFDDIRKSVDAGRYVGFRGKVEMPSGVSSYGTVFITSFSENSSSGEIGGLCSVDAVPNGSGAVTLRVILLFKYTDNLVASLVKEYEIP